MGKNLLLAIFCSPAYFARRKQRGAFVINLCFYITAWIMLISIIGAPFSPIPWMAGFAHAMFFIRQEMLHEAASVMAEKMAEKMATAKTGQP